MSARIVTMLKLRLVTLNVALPRPVILAVRGTAKVPGRQPKYWERGERRVSSSSREEREKKNYVSSVTDPSSAFPSLRRLPRTRGTRTSYSRTVAQHSSGCSPELAFALFDNNRCAIADRHGIRRRRSCRAAIYRSTYATSRYQHPSRYPRSLFVDACTRASHVRAYALLDEQRIEHRSSSESSSESSLARRD